MEKKNKLDKEAIKNNIKDKCLNLYKDKMQYLTEKEVIIGMALIFSELGKNLMMYEQLDKRVKLQEDINRNLGKINDKLQNEITYLQVAVQELQILIKQNRKTKKQN